MPKRGKKYVEAGKGYDFTAKLGLKESIELALEATYAKFDETVDVAVRLGVDPRHADQMVRGTCILPNGLGKEVRVLVFAKGEKAKEAEQAGADYVGLDDLVEKFRVDGWSLIRLLPHRIPWELLVRLVSSLVLEVLCPMPKRVQ